MFEGVVAYALNKYLGRFVEDLDSEQLNVGIFSGTVHLTDLHLKAEALAGLDLPIEVKGGCIGKITIDIPWTSLYYDPVLVNVEEVLILAGPTADRKHDPEKDKRLSRAHKSRRLEDARPPDPEVLEDRPRGFMENLMTTIVNNVQISLQSVHVRYEDSVSTNSPLACGFILQHFTALTTNSRWKACTMDSDARSVFKLLRVESMSLYWNPNCPINTLVKAQLNSDGWKTLLRKGLATFSINGEDFDFLIKPVSMKTKMILNKSKEPKVPKLLLDFVLQDAASQLTREQFVSMYELGKAFELMSLSQRFRRYFRGLSVRGHANDYWKDAYTAVLEEYVKPYTWSRIKEHRNKYREYKSMYKDHLHHPTDTELRLDLQLLEDSLDVTSILAAREQAKMEIAEEEPDLVRKVASRKSWSFWNWFSSSGEEPEWSSLDGPPPKRARSSSEEELLIVGDKERSWWSRMTAEERRRLFEGIGYERWGPDDPDETLNHIGHKLNFTFANCTLAFVNKGREVMLATVTHFLSSLETRPSARAYKISARTESLVIEGASLEHDLVPIVTADTITSGSNVPHIFALDFEKNPSHVNASYGLTVIAEPMEVVYHKYAMKELLDFFELPRVSVELLKQRARQKMKILAEAGKEKIVSAFANHQMMHLNVDLKSPYFVIPEHGSLQQGGSVIVVDAGRLTINTDLQSDVPEESTKMEAEERLYDRFNVSLSDIQVLFSDSGEEWRLAKQTTESDMHLVPKSKVLVVFSNSLRPDCKTLPRHKLNISVPTLKLNLSDRRVSMIADFFQNIPIPQSKSEPRDLSSSISDYHLCRHALKDQSGSDLREVWKCLHRKQKEKEIPPEPHESNKLATTLQRSFSASDHSDEEDPGGSVERWARMVDLPGFEDNVSASNYIRILFRFVAGEVSIHLARSSDHADKPYLMLRLEKLCVDAAHMVYGPALQASLHRIQLVDKLHKGASGEYLELISSDNAADMITVLYRKVQANCPEFKSHFHQVEHSLVLDVSTLSMAFHREAFVTLARFLQYVAAKMKPKSPPFKLTGMVKPTDLVLTDSSDPPVPPGATKFSISARMNALRVRLCDTDLDLADLKVAGLETDYVLKANEKSVLRVDLSELCMEDLVEDTLYKKVLSTEGDKVFDIKWVRRSPHHKEMIEGKAVDSLPVRVDGSLRVRFGRTVVVMLHSFVNELHRFLDPFLNPDTTTFFKRSTEEKFHQKVSEFQQSGLRYQVSVEIQAPTLLFPQKATSPNTLVLQLGELSVENFFQEEQDHCIDNLLIRLHALQMSRAVILLDSRMDVLEPILEPLKLRLDIKRALKPTNKEGLLYQVNGSMDLIKINVGQRDLSTMIAIYQDNYARLQFLDSHKTSDISPDAESCPDETVRKLEVFLYASTEVRRETTFTFIMEGVVLTLFADADDIHSTNSRDPEQALTSFSLDEASLSLHTMNDKSLELKCSCQAATLVDMRAQNTSSLRKIFQSYSGDAGGCTGVACISLSMPPMVDLTYRKNSSGDASVDAVVEKIRLNVSISYLMGVLKFISDALPGSRLPSSSAFLGEEDVRRRLPSDCTSGYLSTVSSDDSKGLSLSVVFRKPEIVLFAQPDAPDTAVLVLKMDVMLDYSYNMGQGNFLLSFAGLHVLSCIYGRRKHTMCTVLHPCEVELNRSLRQVEEEVKIGINVSSVQLCLSAPVVQTILQVSQQLMSSMQEEEDKRIYRLEREQKIPHDLWSPSSLYKQKWSEPECTCGFTRGQFILPKYTESLTINVPELLVWCEVSGVLKNIPVLYAKGTFEAEIKDWSTQMNASGEMGLEVMYFNEKGSTWEPMLEHVLIREGQYRPLEIMFKVFRDRAHPMVCSGGEDLESNTKPYTTTDAAASECSLSSSGNDSEDDDVITTTVIRKRVPIRAKRLSSIAKSRDSTSFVACPGDSDSEGEDGVLEKIASTFDHLFSEDEEGASDEPPSDSEGIADLDAPSDSGETETADNEDVFDDAAAPVYSSPHRYHHHHEHRSVDAVSDTALYLTIDCRDTINVNVTPAAISAVQDVFNEFTSTDTLNTPFVCTHERKELLLRNSLGPEATVAILKKNDKGTYDVAEETLGRAPKKTLPDPDLVTPLVDISPADSDSEMAGDDNDGFHMSGMSASVLKHSVPSDSMYEEKSIAQLYEDSTQEKLQIQVENFDKLGCLLPHRTATTMYALQPVKNNTRYFVLVDTEISHGQRTVSVRSPLKIQNHLGRPVHILCKKVALESAGAASEDYSKNPFHDKFVRLTTLQADATYHVPLLVAYHCKLYIRPLPVDAESTEYGLSSEGIWWKDMTVPQKSSKFLECFSEADTEDISCTKVVCEENRDLKTPSVGTKLVPNFSLHLYPPFVFHNLLPLTLDIHVKNKDKTMRLKEGESATFFDFNPRQSQDVYLEVGQYVGLQWHGKMSVSGDTEELHPVSMSPETDTGGGNRHLSLHVHVTRDQSVDLYLFAPYWIINKSGLPLQLRGSHSDAVYEATSSTDPVLFRFKKHRKKKAKLRVYSSQWSRSFSLDAVGNCGVVICADKERNKKYHFFVNVEMSKMFFTKVVVIKPFFLVINNTENHLRFMEKNEATDLWFDIAPDKCLPFWPDTDSLKLFVKLRDSKTVSQHFPIDFPHVTVLRMEHGCGLKVVVKSGEDFPTTVAFQPYIPGDAPVRVDNYCEDLFLKIHQKSQSQVTLLNPYQSVLYTWDDPSQDRTLIWNLYNRKRIGFPARITKDGYGFEKVSFHSLRKTLVQQPSFRSSSMEQSSSSDDDSESEDGLLPKKTRKDKVVVHWVSYVEREQRVLLFTQDDRIARAARKAVDGERASLEFFLSLNGMGVSLVNDAHRELAYASLTPCPAIWEIEVNHSWKLLTLELSAWLEDKWNADQHKAQLKEYLQVDLSKMQMMKPFFGQLRRFYSPAFWFQLRKSPYQTYAHLKVHRFQVDNQLPDAVFPTVLHPGTTPQYVVRRSGPKPFFESAFLLHTSRSTKTLKFCKVLVQELHIHLDKGFLLSVHDMFSRFQNSSDEVTKLREDMKMVQAPVVDMEKQPRRRSRNGIAFEYIHLSPMVVHFSFSPRGTVHRAAPQSSSFQGDVVDVLLSSVGAALTEIKNVEIKLAFYERRGVFCKPQDLIIDIRSHYQSQLVQQVYVMVLGLDILGNPYGLLKDFTRGLGDFFYEPYLGAVKGPDEFAESLARGAQSLLGHVIGGTAGAISLVTGSLGQTCSVLTFDEDYRKKRQQRLQLRSNSLPESLGVAAKSFVLGVILGLSGVVVQPITGGQQEGAEGFFRGIGKGLLGLITKPAGGVMDMVGMAFDGIRRAAEMGESVVLRMRLPRYINPADGLRPYSPYLSSGCHLLEQVSKGHYAETDVYWAHAALTPEDRTRVALVTDRHLFLLEKGRFFGGWDVEWVISVDDVLTVPHILGNNLVVKVKQEDWILNFAGDERYIQSDDLQILEWLKDKVEKVLLYNMRGKPCPI